jgi:hypothetical protein
MICLTCHCLLVLELQEKQLDIIESHVTTALLNFIEVQDLFVKIVCCHFEA